ncbi:group III truncated hemoglobin [Faecalibacter bovis]|uniref:Group III truncated hemoglobin n=1 Tax=Faecalibacter bovis TaxID=2898187 RepID=A0ABX7XDB1_9FLAO|nr:group III truncated hemoglobin [Faecalibacter bovis]MBS7334289.1 group III truncated hemoglobin [Weeksellaceae bacterium]QTV05872.1 group III truncated hemoglobin [Faecalibacter bovis]
MKKDISNSEDVEFLVNQFYDLVVNDELIGPFFNNVANVNWDEHLPHMVQFWETVLLGKATFEGWPMRTHLVLNKKASLKEEHFERWIEYWYKVLDENFEGPVALEAKNRAKIMRDLILFKIEQQKTQNIIQ